MFVDDQRNQDLGVEVRDAALQFLDPGPALSHLRRDRGQVFAANLVDSLCDLAGFLPEPAALGFVARREQEGPEMALDGRWT
jgi:hypothetical protein